MFIRQQVKAQGKAAMRANYWPSVGVGILLTIAIGAGSAASGRAGGSQSQELGLGMADLSPEEMGPLLIAIGGAIMLVAVLAAVFKLLVGNPLIVGCRRYFADNLYRPAPAGTVASGFMDGYGRNVGAMFLVGFLVGLWSLLFVIPGLVKSYSYRLTPYILSDYPELSATEAITLSRQMMNGNKLDAFVFDLSFLGWELLSVITCGIVGVFYVNPYVASADAAMYEAIKANYQGGQYYA